MATKAELEAQIEELREQNRRLTDALMAAIQAKPSYPYAVYPPAVQPYVQPAVQPYKPWVQPTPTWTSGSGIFVAAEHPNGTVTINGGLSIVRRDDEDPDGFAGAKIA